jgi:head-tail adaptor
MASIAPAGAGELRQVVSFERRATTPDGYGNTEGAWVNLIDRRAAKLDPTRGGEQVIAQRLQAQSSWDLWVRFDSSTSGVTPGDRCFSHDDPFQVFNIDFAQDMNDPRPRHWILMQLTLGKADG